MEQVKHLLNRIEHRLHECIDENEFTYDALKRMEKKNIDCVLVLREGFLVGIFSEHGYARDVVSKGQSSWNTALKKIMRTDFSVVGLDTPVSECIEIVKQQRGRYIPVIEEGSIVGVLSAEDLDHAVIRDQGCEIELLKDYVYGRRG